MNQNKLNTVKHFIKFCKKELNIQSLPSIKFIKDRSFVEQNRSYGEYNPNENSLKVFILNRNLADICRSLAHELTHHRQNELDMLESGSGDTGSSIEDEANAMAGILMRDYGKLNLSVYDLGDALNEEIKVALYPGKKGVDIDSTDEDIKNSPKVQIPLDKLFRNEPADKMKQPESVENIKNLAAMYKKGKKVDPILVCKKGSKFQILDGHHRFTAAKLAGLESINAIVVPDENITPVDKDGNLLKEIGEGTKAFPWQFTDMDDDGNYFYSFETDKHKYGVGIANLEDGMYELSFNTTEHSSLDTNEGVMLKVMSTVVEIAKDFINRAKPDAMYFRPIKTGGPEDSRRGRIYAAYLNKNLPSDYKIIPGGDTLRVIKK